MRREYPTDIGPVDLLCRDADGGAVAVEIKRRGDIDGVEQLARYLERLDLDPTLRPVRGIFVAQQIKPQARVLAESRDLGWVEVDYDELRGIESRRAPAVLTVAHPRSPHLLLSAGAEPDDEADGPARRDRNRHPSGVPPDRSSTNPSVALPHRRRPNPSSEAPRPGRHLRRPDAPLTERSSWMHRIETGQTYRSARRDR